ncbi:MAG TPA: phosphopyruvate hydratase [Mycobacteriales bacterium]|nr:phosphopyruvate hydratase [Mycobacteriales bacterium]
MVDSTIAAVDAWEVLDSRGNPTVAAGVHLGDGSYGQATVPSGASTGRHEVHELRDGGDRYGGKGVLQAVTNVRTELADAVRGLDGANQRAVDRTLRETDGTADLSRLGANAVLAVSVATAIAASTAHSVPLYEWVGGDSSLPLPMVNILSGGAHAGRCLDIQDVLVIALEAPTFAVAIEQIAAVRRAAVALATEQGLPAGLVADEGGLGLPLGSNERALDFVVSAIERAGFAPGSEVALALDVAASQFCRDGGYHLDTEGRSFDRAGWLDEIEKWVRNHPVVSIEDAVDEDDWESWAELTRRLGERVQLLGDDFFVTNAERLDRGIRERSANAILVKPNQSGTLTGAADVVRSAHDAGFGTVVSARSGETEDSWIADLAVGWGAGQLKVGSTTRSERTAKWNRVLALEHSTGMRYHGRRALAKGMR